MPVSYEIFIYVKYEVCADFKVYVWICVAQGTQDALLQHQARGEGRIADAGGCSGGTLGESVAADKRQPRRLATPATLPGVAHQSHSHRAVLAVPRRERPRCVNASGARYSVHPSAKWFVQRFRLSFYSSIPDSFYIRVSILASLRY